MSFYIYSDIATEEEFDLKVEYGDIAIEEVPLALANMVAFRIMTSSAEWTFDPAAMAGVKSYLGGINNEELLSRIKRDLASVLFRGFTIKPNDLTIDIFKSQSNPNEAVIIVELKNLSYVDKDNIEHNDESVQSTYYLDTLTGKLTFIDDII